MMSEIYFKVIKVGVGVSIGENSTGYPVLIIIETR